MAVKRVRPESTTALVQGADRDMADGGGVNGVAGEKEGGSEGREGGPTEGDTEMGGS